MSKDETTRYVVVGAGAVGCAVGGLLSISGSRVLFVARPTIAQAIERGIVIRRDGNEVLVRGDALTSARDINPGPGDIAVITVKSQATSEVVEELAAVYGSATPVVCLQNAVRNEESAARRFNKVHAGLVLLTAVQLDPAIVRISQGRTIAVGCYPDGVDSIAQTFCDDLTAAGFEAIASPYVMAMKWGKLITNLNNATHAITGYWLERALAEPEMRRLMLEVREEGLRVLEAAGIAAEAPENEPSPIRIRKMTEDLRRPPREADGAASLPEELRAYPSMWQDLYLGRGSNEADLLNGEIVRLGKQLGIPTPYNEVLLEIINRMTAEQLKPGLYTPSELRRLIPTRDVPA